jgi:hypothetical protein
MFSIGCDLEKVYVTKCKNQKVRILGKPPPAARPPVGRKCSDVWGPLIARHAAARQTTGLPKESCTSFSAVISVKLEAALDNEQAHPATRPSPIT